VDEAPPGTLEVTPGADVVVEAGRLVVLRELVLVALLLLLDLVDEVEEVEDEVRAVVVTWLLGKHCEYQGF
jgi:hypothetical protein